MSYSISDRITIVKNEFQKRFADSKPFTQNSFLGSILGAFGGALFGMDREIDKRVDNLYIDTADLEHLLLLNNGKTEVLQPIASKGNLLVMGVLNHSIASNTLFNNQDSKEVKSTSTAQILEVSVSSAFTVKATDYKIIIELEEVENIGRDTITISDSTATSINGTYTDFKVVDRTITIVTTSTGTFNDTSTNAKIKTRFALVPIETVVKENYTAKKDNPFELVVTSANVTSALIANGGLYGGRGEETEESLRERMLTDIRTPQPFFTESYIKTKIKEKYGVSIYIKSHYPSINLFTVFPTNINENYYRVSDTIKDEIKAYLLSIKPINVLDTAVFVETPKYTTLDFKISGLIPNTKNIRDLIKLNIDYYLINQDIEGKATVEGLKATIYSTVDYTTKEKVSAFTINMSSDVTAPKDSVLVWTGGVNA